MKRLIILCLALVSSFVLISCGNNADKIDPSEITDKIYVYEKGGFSGIDGDNFTISINADGTWTYSEGLASSHFAIPDRCSWELDGDMLILTELWDGDVERINRFKVDGDSLIYQSEESENFIYTKVADGEKFNSNVNIE